MELAPWQLAAGGESASGPAPETEPSADIPDGPKQVTGYCEPWTLRAGTTVRLMASSHEPASADIEIVRLVCGDPTGYGPGFEERSVPEAGSWSVTLDEQPLTPGSYATADVGAVPAGGPYIGLKLWVMPTSMNGWHRVATLTAPIPESLRARLDSDDAESGDDLRLTLPPKLRDAAQERPAAQPSRIDLAIDLVDGHFMARYPGRGVYLGERRWLEEALAPDRWYLVEALIEVASDRLYLFVATTPSTSPARDIGEAALVDISVADMECWTFFEAYGLEGSTESRDGSPYDIYADARSAMPSWTEHGTARREWGATGWPDTMFRFPPNPSSLPVRPWLADLAPAELWLGGGPDGERFDGRIARPVLVSGGASCTWDLGREMEARSLAMVPEPSGDGGAGRLVLHQLPTRAVTGPAWDGSALSWEFAPSQYDAVHFHHDDVYDADWDVTVEATLPDDLQSGIYAFRVRSDAGEDRVPFFVRPARGAPTAEIALLAPTATYMAYANHRMQFEGADFMPTRERLSPEHAYIRDHRELGPSHCEKHPDGSSVMFSSRRRPVLNLRPGADGWNFTPDTVINAFLEHLDLGHDVITDEDLHAEGVEAIAPYRVLVTGSHPEHWSTAMLDALAHWQRRGGRLMYLGGNGFCLRVAFSEEWPGAVELRRAEDDARNRPTGSGESHHAWGGERGGMWRRHGRAPNEICGVGFAAQGFEKAACFVRDPGAGSSRAAWILDGVLGENIGTSGLGGGAAGQEVDRYDPQLGSPGHAVVLASATAFGPDMRRAKEEFEGSVFLPTPDPMVRADMVFYETPNGGAVFSVGSISWFGALAHDGYDNDVARITANVVRRFIDPEPFLPPAAG